MRFSKHVFPLAVILLLTVIIAACGTTTSTSNPGPYGPGNSSNATLTTSGSTPTAASSGSAMTVRVATATVKGQSMQILTNAQGLTLYYLTADTATKSACTGGCAKFWPPLLMTGSASPVGPSSLTGTLSVASTGNGNQVEYNGHPLYTFSGDKAPGQANGEGFQGVWFVATPDLQQQQSGTPSRY